MEKDPLLSVLIGLARATDGSEHLINPEASAVIVESLAAIHTGGELSGLAEKVTEEKRKMIPNCFTCCNPCGRTSDYDMNLIHTAPEPIRSLKYRLLDRAGQLAARYTPEMDASVFYRALIVLGMDDAALIETILAEINSAGA